MICFRLNFTKDHTTNAIAGATVRQLVPVIFERISGQAAEERQLREEPSPQFAQLVASILPKDTDPFVVDAYLMFQDIVVSSGRPKGSFCRNFLQKGCRKSFGFGRKKFSHFGISAERGRYCRKRVFLQKEAVSAEIGG